MSPRYAVVLVALALSSAASADPSPRSRGATNATLAPANLAIQLRDGECFTPTDTLMLPTNVVPGQLDLMIMIDVSSSMNGVIGRVKLNAQSVIDAVRGLIPNSHFGVMTHVDYPLAYQGTTECPGGHIATSTHFPYRLNQPLIGEADTVKSVLASLTTIGGGNDFDESYSLPLQKSYTDDRMGWRPGAKRIVLQFGDDVPHDCAFDAITGGTNRTRIDPGEDNIVGTPDDLRILDVLDGMVANNVVLIAMHSGRFIDLWDAYSRRTGGQGVQLDGNGNPPAGTDLAGIIASRVQTAVVNVDRMALSVCNTEFAGWLSSVQPPEYTALTLDHDQALEFNPRICVPPGTAPGTYAFDICAIGDGAEYARQHVEIQVQNQPPLTLACPTATGQVAQEYSSALVASGGTPPYHYAIDTPLQTGLDFVPSTGVIYGFPQVSGTVNFTAYAIDAVNDSASIACSITIAPLGPTPLVVACSDDTIGSVGSFYSSQLAATGGTPPYTFSADPLPPGLEIDTQTGIISGTPTTAGVFDFTARANDSAEAFATASCRIQIGSALSVSCPTDTGRVSFEYSSALVASGGTPPYRYAIDTPLQTGLDFVPSTGMIYGFPQVPGTVNFTAYTIDSVNDSASISCSITIAPAAVVVVCPQVTLGRVGNPYSSQLLASGGTPPYRFSADSLPPGLELDAQSGAISGTPTQGGVFGFNARVDDAAKASGFATCSIEIVGSTLTVSCPTGSGRVGEEYNSALVASGGTPPYRYAIDTPLQAGLDFSPTTGVIYGFPQVAGVVNFNAFAIDALNDSATIACLISIEPVALTLDCPDTTTGQVGVFYSVRLRARGGVEPYFFAIESGELPQGLALDTNSGVISGTPTVAGTTSYVARVADFTADTVRVQCQITINPSAPTLTVACPETTTGHLGVPFHTTIPVSGGTPPYNFSILGSLPAGLELDAGTGVISGTPTVVGIESFDVRVFDSAENTALAECSITILPTVAPISIECPETTVGRVGVPFSAALRASGGATPYFFAIEGGSLPVGLEVHPNTGVISGTPTAEGTSTFIARVASGAEPPDTARVTCSITIEPAGVVLALDCPPQSRAEVGVPYSSQLAASGGTPPYAFSIVAGGLPAGLALNGSSGAVTGTPTSPGPAPFAARVVDAAGDTATVRCRIDILGAPQPLTVICPEQTTGEVGDFYRSRIMVRGGVPPFQFAITAGALPPGLALSALVGTINGTPTTVGSFPFTATVTDSTGASASVECRIDIRQESECTGIAPTITELWPPNHKLIPIAFTGLDGRRFTVTSVTQDEPLDWQGAGASCADAVFEDGILYLRAERSAQGNGRVYTISFRAGDLAGGVCTGTAQVCVPHDRGKGSSCLRDAVTVNSLGTCTSRSAAETTEAIAFAVRVAGSTASAVTFEYSLPADSDVEFALYDIGGRRISTIERSQRTVGTYSAVWNTAGTPRGMYFYRLRAGSRVVSGALPLVR